MKNLVMLAVLVFSQFAVANDIYTTSTGAVFTQVQGPGAFGESWRDPNGTIWSSFQGQFNNLAILSDQNGVVMDSDATEACAKIGGALPRVEDFYNLFSYFDHAFESLQDTQEEYLTSQGAKDFRAIFSENYGWGLWSSSLDPAHPGCAYYNGIYIESLPRGYGNVGVRCISR